MDIDKELDQAFIGGLRAESENENPYEIGSTLWREWMNGFYYG